MNDLIQEAINVVKSINEEIYEQHQSEFIPINCCTDGDEVCIEFLNQHIWTSIEDEREYLDDKDDWEPLEQFVRIKIMELINEIKNINL